MAVRNYDIGKFERNYNSQSNRVLDSLVGIEAKAEETANRMKVSVDEIYAKLGFDPISYQLENNKFDAWTEEIEQMVIEKLDRFAVPKYNRKMTTFGAAMAVLMAPDPKSILGKGAVTDNGVHMDKEVYPVKKAFDIADYIFEHKKAIGIAFLGMLGLYAAGNAYVNASKTEHVDDTDTGIAKAKAEIGAGGGVIIGGSAINASANAQVTPAPYQYDARIGNPDPAIPFIDIPEDIELADALQKQMDAWMEKSPNYTKEMPKYLVLRGGINPTPGYGAFTKDGRQIIYLGDNPDRIEQIKKYIPHWGIYSRLNHEIGHDKFNKKDDGCIKSKCIEMPAIKYSVYGDIDAGLIHPSKEQERIDLEWKGWKDIHNYTEE